MLYVNICLHVCICWESPRPFIKFAFSHHLICLDVISRGQQILHQAKWAFFELFICNFLSLPQEGPQYKSLSNVSGLFKFHEAATSLTPADSAKMVVFFPNRICSQYLCLWAKALNDSASTRVSGKITGRLTSAGGGTHLHLSSCWLFHRQKWANSLLRHLGQPHGRGPHRCNGLKGETSCRWLIYRKVCGDKCIIKLTPIGLFSNMTDDANKWILNLAKNKVSSKKLQQSVELFTSAFEFYFIYFFTCVALSHPRFTIISLDKLMGMLSFWGFFRHVNRNLRSWRINTLKRKGYEKGLSETLNSVLWWCFVSGKCLLRQCQKRLPLWRLLCTTFTPKLHWCFLKSARFCGFKEVFHGYLHLMSRSYMKTKWAGVTPTFKNSSIHCLTEPLRTRFRGRIT